MEQRTEDVVQRTLLILVVVGLMVACFWVLRPFLLATVWAAILVLASWRLMLAIQRRVGGSRLAASLIMTTVLLILVIVPFGLATHLILDNLDAIAGWVRAAVTAPLPPPPAWLADIPLVGPRAAASWAKLAATGLGDVLPVLMPYAGKATLWFAAVVGGLGNIVLTLLLTAVIAAVFYVNGEGVARTATRLGRRLGGDRGEGAVLLAARSVKSVALAVVLTAVAQSAIGSLGLVVVGGPGVHVLSAIMFVLCLAQLGPAPVLVPVVLILYAGGDFGRATVLLGFCLVAMTVDQFIRPILIRKGGDLPLLLILAGVIGGLISFGLLGIFVGPAILAVAYTLLGAWLVDADGAAGDDQAPPPPAVAMPRWP